MIIKFRIIKIDNVTFNKCRQQVRQFTQEVVFLYTQIMGYKPRNKNSKS